MKLFDVYPLWDITITRAEGSTLWDDNGVEYLDMYGGHAVISIGHSNPHYIDAITSQLNSIGFYSNSIHIPSQRRLATLLGTLSSKEDYALFLCNSGAEANENALKVASFHTGRRLCVTFGGSFHGRTSLVVAATDNPKIVAPINETDNIVFLPYNDIEALQKFMSRKGTDVSSIIMEAVQGVGGVNVSKKEFAKAIRRLCDEYGAMFIADEVQCGCGRTGRYFALDNYGVKADIYSMAKGIGNGFPIGAIMISPKIKASYGLLGTTFGGNHLAVAAAISVAEQIKSQGLMENAKRQGDYLMEELCKLKALCEEHQSNKAVAEGGEERVGVAKVSKYGCIKDVRGEGLMIGVEMDCSSTDLRRELLFKHHIFVGSANNPNIFRLLPSLTITKADIDRTIVALKEELLG